MEMSWAAQDVGDLGEDAGLVDRWDLQVVGTDHAGLWAGLVRRRFGARGTARLPRATSTKSATTAEAVGMPPAPGPTYRVGTDGAAVDHYRVSLTPATLARSSVSGDQGRVDARLDAGVGEAGYAQMLDGKAEFAGRSGCPRCRPARCLPRARR